MTGKWRLEECRRWKDLTADEVTQRRLREITYCEVEETVRTIIEWRRTLIYAARSCGLSTEGVKNRDLDNDKTATLARAYFVGAERGMRIGKLAAERMISEAHKYARLQLANSAPWLEEVEPIDDD